MTREEIAAALSEILGLLCDARMACEHFAAQNLGSKLGDLCLQNRDTIVAALRAEPSEEEVERDDGNDGYAPCSSCGALPDEPCRFQTGKLTPGGCGTAP